MTTLAAHVPRLAALGLGADSPLYNSVGRAVRLYQLGERVAVQLFHNARLVDLDGARADTELCGDIAVLMARRDEREDLAFTVRQSLEAAVSGGLRRRRRAPLAIHSQSVVQHIEQHGVVYRLLEEIERAALEGGASRGDIAVCGQNHDRHLDLPLVQRGLQLKSGHSRHAQV